MSRLWELLDDLRMRAGILTPFERAVIADARADFEESEEKWKQHEQDVRENPNWVQDIDRHYEILDREDFFDRILHRGEYRPSAPSRLESNAPQCEPERDM